MKKKIFIILFISLAVLESCQFYEEKDLGNNLILWERDGRETQYDIVYCGGYSLGSCKGGIYVLPTMVNKYSMYVETAKSNDRWVIAKTIDVENQDESYWIIGKSYNLKDINCLEVSCDSLIQSHVIGALDYENFTNKSKELGIDLKFEE